jgi:pyruvate dehydrogenase E2 component (dihydrolipoamide acetyltransferase)
LAVVVDDEKVVSAFKDFQISSGQVKENEKIESAPAASTKETTSSPPKKEATTMRLPPDNNDRIKASPLAKALAKESKVDLSKIFGSGPGGRIVKNDVLEQPKTVRSLPEQHLEERVKYTDIPVSGMRKTIAERLSFSTQSVPHFYLTIDDINMTSVLKARSQLNAEASRLNMKLSVNDFVIKAAAIALKVVPEVNSQWNGDIIRQFDTVDVSFAVATESGLLTPIVKDADRLGLLQMASTTRDLADRAKLNKLKPSEFQGGTFTVSNLGMFGISHFTAIINPPQSAILAVGATRNDGMMSVTLSCDHRVIDGATGARWLKEFRAFMEEPFKLLL